MKGINTDSHAGILDESGLHVLYQYRTTSVRHLPELQGDIDRLKHSGKLSDQTTYQGYINKLGFSLPENFPEAKSIITMATLTKPMKVNFHVDGTTREIFLPPQYYEDGLTEEMLLKEVKEKIIRESGTRVEWAPNLHLKLLAVRSGLGRYGRNNICYVNGFGSFITLFAFFTDYPFESDSWHEIQMMDICQKCRICLNQCPTGAIREEIFVIAAGNCISLYNEVEGKFPDWIPEDAHNALMGCTRCQVPCPANREPLNYTGRLEDITFQETIQFLSGQPDEKTMASVSEKLRIPHMVGSQKVYDIVRRNLSVLLS